MKKTIIILLLAGAVVYSFNLTNQLFWDDIEWIALNSNVHSFSLEHIKSWFTKNVLDGIGLSSNYYRPFLFATFTTNYVVHQMRPLGWHIVSNGIHIANGILLFFILTRLFNKKFVAFWVSLIFLIHPLQTEAVTYISGRGDPLAAFFMFLAILCFLRHQLWPSLLSLVLALLSRETAIMFPFLILIIWISFLSKKRFWPSVREAFGKAWSYFAVVIVYGLLRLTILNLDNTLNFFSDSVSGPYSESIFVRLYTFLSIIPSYFRLLLVPLGQHMDRNPAVYTSITFWQVWVPLLVLLACLSLVVLLYLKKKPYASIVFFGFFWFFATLSPMSGITPVNGIMYEHWLYLPLIGPFAVLVYFISLFSFRRVAVGILIGTAIWFSYLSIRQNLLWGDSAKFYQNILKYEPASARTLTNLANIYFDQNKYAEAEDYYLKAVRTNTAFPQAYYNLARLYRDQGKHADALPLLEKAIARDKTFFYAYQEQAIIFAYLGRFKESRDALLSLKELRPNDPRVYLNLGKIDQILKNYESAIQWLSIGIALSDNDPEAKKEIGDLLDVLQNKR